MTLNFFIAWLIFFTITYIIMITTFLQCKQIGIGVFLRRTARIEVVTGYADLSFPNLFTWKPCLVNTTPY